MERKIIVVGDPPICGGRVLPYQASFSSTIHDHHVALIGGRAYCEGCNSVGIIAKTGGPRRMEFVSEVALEGDVVVCHCPQPQPLRAVLQSTSTYDDGWENAPELPDIMSLPRAGSELQDAAFKRVVDGDVTHPPEAAQTERICPRMTNKEFANLMLKLRDRAIHLIVNKRLVELQRWSTSDRARVSQWFGSAEESVRAYLESGLTSCARVLRGLREENFVRFSLSSLRHVGCTMEPPTGVVAAVCKPDTHSHTIAIHLDFCDLRETSATFDSQLSTLVHEVTHFDDTFGSFDTIYHLGESLKAAQENPEKVRTNADTIAGYVVWGEAYEG